MKVLTVLGTRPEIIRLSRVIPALDALTEHVLVHTGQNIDGRLSDLFFDELALRSPDHYLGVSAQTFGEQIGQIVTRIEQVLLNERPDRVLVLGDTNSGLSALVAKRLGILVLHLEAGNRCWDDGVPEEVNRRVIDHASDVLMPYTHRSRENLLAEGIESRRIHVIGNPILEVLTHNQSSISSSDVVSKLGLEPQRYFLATIHREENVDTPRRLLSALEAFERISQLYALPVVCSVHPRTRRRIEASGLATSEQVRLCEPFGFFDFIALEQHALCVLSDSGTVQEECCILGVRNVTIRDSTERPETIDCGSNLLAGIAPDSIIKGVGIVLSQPTDWVVPAEYTIEDVSRTVARITLGYGRSRNLPT